MRVTERLHGTQMRVTGRLHGAHMRVTERLHGTQMQVTKRLQGAQMRVTERLHGTQMSAWHTDACMAHRCESQSVYKAFRCESQSTCMARRCESRGACMAHTCESQSACMAHRRSGHARHTQRGFGHPSGSATLRHSATADGVKTSRARTLTGATSVTQATRQPKTTGFLRWKTCACLLPLLPNGGTRVGRVGPSHAPAHTIAGATPADPPPPPLLGSRGWDHQGDPTRTFQAS